MIEEENSEVNRRDKVLGITWDHIEDTLNIGLQDAFEKAHAVTPTKRNILKIIASIYDPIGFLAPVVVNLKLIFQEICQKKIGWDDHIGDLEDKIVLLHT